MTISLRITDPAYFNTQEDIISWYYFIEFLYRSNEITKKDAVEHLNEIMKYMEGKSNLRLKDAAARFEAIKKEASGNVDSMINGIKNDLIGYADDLYSGFYKQIKNKIDSIVAESSKYASDNQYKYVIDYLRELKELRKKLDYRLMFIDKDSTGSEVYSEGISDEKDTPQDIGWYINEIKDIMNDPGQYLELQIREESDSNMTKILNRIDDIADLSENDEEKIKGIYDDLQSSAVSLKQFDYSSIDEYEDIRFLGTLMSYKLENESFDLPSQTLNSISGGFDSIRDWIFDTDKAEENISENIEYNRYIKSHVMGRLPDSLKDDILELESKKTGTIDHSETGGLNKKYRYIIYAFTTLVGYWLMEKYWILIPISSYLVERISSEIEAKKAKEKPEKDILEGLENIKIDMSEEELKKEADALKLYEVEKIIDQTYALLHEIYKAVERPETARVFGQLYEIKHALVGMESFAGPQAMNSTIYKENRQQRIVELLKLRERLIRSIEGQRILLYRNQKSYLNERYGGKKEEDKDDYSELKDKISRKVRYAEIDDYSEMVDKNNFRYIRLKKILSFKDIVYINMGMLVVLLKSSILLRIFISRSVLVDDIRRLLQYSEKAAADKRDGLKRIALIDEMEEIFKVIRPVFKDGDIDKVILRKSEREMMYIDNTFIKTKDVEVAEGLIKRLKAIANNLRANIGTRKKSIFKQMIDNIKVIEEAKEEDLYEENYYNIRDYDKLVNRARQDYNRYIAHMRFRNKMPIFKQLIEWELLRYKFFGGQDPEKEIDRIKGVRDLLDRIRDISVSAGINESLNIRKAQYVDEAIRIIEDGLEKDQIDLDKEGFENIAHVIGDIKDILDKFDTEDFYPRRFYYEQVKEIFELVKDRLEYDEDFFIDLANEIEELGLSEEEEDEEETVDIDPKAEEKIREEERRETEISEAIYSLRMEIKDRMRELGFDVKKRVSVMQLIGKVLVFLKIRRKQSAEKDDEADPETLLKSVYSMLSDHNRKIGLSTLQKLENLLSVTNEISDVEDILFSKKELLEDIHLRLDRQDIDVLIGIIDAKLSDETLEIKNVERLKISRKLNLYKKILADQSHRSMIDSSTALKYLIGILSSIVPTLADSLTDSVSMRETLIRLLLKNYERKFSAEFVNKLYVKTTSIRKEAGKSSDTEKTIISLNKMLSMIDEEIVKVNRELDEEFVKNTPKKAIYISFAVTSFMAFALMALGIFTVSGTENFDYISIARKTALLSAVINAVYFSYVTSKYPSYRALWHKYMERFGFAGAVLLMTGIIFYNPLSIAGAWLLSLFPAAIISNLIDRLRQKLENSDKISVDELSGRSAVSRLPHFITNSTLYKVIDTVYGFLKIVVIYAKKNILFPFSPVKSAIKYLKKNPELNIYPGEEYEILVNMISKVVNNRNVAYSNLLLGNQVSEVYEWIKEFALDKGDIVSVIGSDDAVLDREESQLLESVTQKRKFTVKRSNTLDEFEEGPKVILISNEDAHFSQEALRTFIDSVPEDVMIVINNGVNIFNSTLKAEMNGVKSNKKVVVIGTMPYDLKLGGGPLAFTITRYELMDEFFKIKHPFNVNSIDVHVAQKYIEHYYNIEPEDIPALPGSMDEGYRKSLSSIMRAAVKNPALVSYPPGKGEKATRKSLEERIPGFDMPIAKLSSNENPRTLPEPVIDALINRLKKMKNGRKTFDYQKEFDLTKEAMADNLKIDPDNIFLGHAGCEAILRMVAAYTGEGTKIVMPAATFFMYKSMSMISGSDIIEVPNNKDLTPDTDALLKTVAAEKPEALVLVNPSNPLGTVMEKAAFYKFIENVKKVSPDTMIMIDEAYYDYAKYQASREGWEYPDVVGDYINSEDEEKGKNIIILRSFSKSLGLAGMRSGYAIAHPDIINKLNKLQREESISAWALPLIRDGLKEKEWLKETVRMNYENKKLILDEFASIKKEFPELGYVDSYRTSGNFLFFWIDGIDGPELFKKFEDKGLIIRPIVGQYLRATIGTYDESVRFITALREILSVEESVGSDEKPDDSGEMSEVSIDTDEYIPEGKPSRVAAFIDDNKKLITISIAGLGIMASLVTFLLTSSLIITAISALVSLSQVILSIYLINTAAKLKTADIMRLSARTRYPGIAGFILRHLDMTAVSIAAIGSVGMMLLPVWVGMVMLPFTLALTAEIRRTIRNFTREYEAAIEHRKAAGVDSSVRPP
ncbi:pyridoxal phosphate-dependent aminotransferase, partial [Elusimicrobiota bacterium]